MPSFGGIPPECVVFSLRSFGSEDRVWMGFVPRFGEPNAALGLTNALLMLRLTFGASPPSAWVADPGAITS